MATLDEERRLAIHLLRSGQAAAEVTDAVGRSVQWVRKWRRRYEAGGWAGVRAQSRAPHTMSNRLPEAIRAAIVVARSELEAEAAEGCGLGYIGGPAVRARLSRTGLTPLPSVATIERVLQAHGLTQAGRGAAAGAIAYPHLHPTQPHELCQVDIVPHFLTGGAAVACFNAIDVVSRYPTGCALAQRRSHDAVAVLLQVWRELGIAHYTQVDTEGCFSGGCTHPYVLGKVVRLALHVGTEVLFSPVQHPHSNGSVERFHQEYHRHVWHATELADLADVNRQAAQFFSEYRQSAHHSALQGQTPTAVHFRTPPSPLPHAFTLPAGKLPLVAGAVHFLRRVPPAGRISVLNVAWEVPTAAPDTGVWVTMTFRLDGATLAVYDAAPDQPARTCLVTHPFPLAESVQPRPGPGETIS